MTEDDFYKFTAGEDIMLGDCVVIKNGMIFRARPNDGDMWDGLQAATDMHKGNVLLVSAEYFRKGLLGPSRYDA